MVDLSDVGAIRGMLAAMCENPAMRITADEVDIERNNWRVNAVTDSATLSRYGERGAWQFIADCLRDGVDVDYRGPTEEFPDHAYVMVHSDGGPRRIYMKVVLKPPLRKLIGVSFHFEKKEVRHDEL